MDKIHGKGVLDRHPESTDSKREHCGDIRKYARNNSTEKYVTEHAREKEAQGSTQTSSETNH